MGNFTASEMLTILVVILIVFGPNRLPEIARKAGALAARARSAVDALKTELTSEYGDVIEPLREARQELRSAGTDLKGAVTEMSAELTAAGQETRRALEETVKPVSPGGPGEVPDDEPGDEPVEVELPPDAGEGDATPEGSSG